MWGVERDPRASLGRRGAHGDGLVGVFRAVSVAAVESLRGSLVNGIAPWAMWESPSQVKKNGFLDHKKLYSVLYRVL